MTPDELLLILDASTAGLPLSERFHLEVLVEVARELESIRGELERLRALVGAKR